MTLTIGVDVGGTKTAVGVVDDTGQVVARSVVPSATDSAERLVQVITEGVAGFRDQYEFHAVGISVAGLVDETARRVRWATHLSLEDFPLADALEESLGQPVVIENDGTAAAWAESQFGAARNCDSALVITVGTGLGGGLLERGRTIRGATGAAGEVGHITLVRNGLACSCGSSGCLEVYASGRAIVRLARAAAVDGAHGAALLAAADGDVANLQGPMVTAAAQQGDPAAIAVLTEVGDALGEGIGGLVSVLDPAIVVIGGGASAAGELLLAPARAALARRVIGAGHRPVPDLVIAACGPDAGLVGAADLTRHPEVMEPGTAS